MTYYTRQNDELRRRGAVRAEHSRFLATRLDRRQLMRRAWALARDGVARWGGNANLYRVGGMLEAWQEHRTRLAVAEGMARDRFALTVTGLLVLREAQAAEPRQLALALE